MTKTFHYQGSLSQFVTFGKVNGQVQVIESTSPDYPVGMVSPEKELRACGWAPLRKKVIRDIWGTQIN